MVEPPSYAFTCSIFICLVSSLRCQWVDGILTVGGFLRTWPPLLSPLSTFWLYRPLLHNLLLPRRVFGGFRKAHPPLAAYLVWMSDRDRLRILERRLLEFAAAFDELSCLATALSAEASYQSEAAYNIAFADWETVAEPQAPPGVPDPAKSIPICSADQGPPDFPEVLEHLAIDQINSINPRPVTRAARAFEIGFWARIGIETRRTITLGRAIPVTDEHWIFWTTVGCGKLRPVRFTCQEDAQRLSDLFPCDRSNHNQATFLVGFPTLRASVLLHWGSYVGAGTMAVSSKGAITFLSRAEPWLCGELARGGASFIIV